MRRGLYRLSQDGKTRDKTKTIAEDGTYERYRMGIKVCEFTAKGGKRHGKCTTYAGGAVKETKQYVHGEVVVQNANSAEKKE